ncbi:hypothetical protein SH139x_004876 [Planctomycetaceae bacterium SH139]
MAQLKIAFGSADDELIGANADILTTIFAIVVNGQDGNRGTQRRSIRLFFDSSLVVRVCRRGE